MTSWTDAAPGGGTSFQLVQRPRIGMETVQEPSLELLGKTIYINLLYTNSMKKREPTLNSEQDEDVPRPGR